MLKTCPKCEHEFEPCISLVRTPKSPDRKVRAPVVCPNCGQLWNVDVHLAAGWDIPPTPTEESRLILIKERLTTEKSLGDSVFEKTAGFGKP